MMSNTTKILVFMLILFSVFILVWWNLMQSGKVLRHGYKHFKSVAMLNTNHDQGTITGKNWNFISNIKQFGKTPYVSKGNGPLKKHIPQAMIVGIKKCGTGPLREFLDFHPSVVAVDSEIHYFDRHYLEGINWYLDQIPAARDDQLTVEKTPRYFVEASVPEKIYRDFSPKTKIIIIACEPVHRAISDYVHTYIHTIKAKKILQTSDHVLPIYKKEVTRLERYSREGYILNDTFESTVIDQDGNVNKDHPVVDTGIYVKYLRNWLQFFPRSQIHIIDGEKFKTNPAIVMMKLQKFLNLEPFFYEDSFYFDEEKGFFCLGKPEKFCLSKNKGRPHPDIDKDVLNTIAEYYKPYEKEFSQVLNQSFVWINS